MTTPGKDYFENIYNQWTSPQYIHPDPLEFLHRYKDKRAIEIVALLAACLAYGNVKQILKSVQNAIKPIENSPFEQLKMFSADRIKSELKGFKHRFTTDAEISCFLINIKNACAKYGSLENLFLAGDKPEEKTIENSLYNFINAFNSNGRAPSLTPDPALKSSFKRINLFLRWVVRKDNVDLGIWEKISPSRLIIPLDTHMRQVALSLGITQRKDTSMKTALEITKFFSGICPEDPVKYDFSLTRAGIRGNNT